jgi:hypothetical protein
MKFGVRYISDGKDDAKKAAKDLQRAAEEAVTRTIDDAKKRGRQSIAAGGFGPRWQNTLTTRFYPNRDRPLSPAAILYHKIPYARVFEYGERVAGKPLLWIPLPSVPPGRGSHALTPAQYRARIGELRSVNRPGKPPMLVGRGSRSSIARATSTEVKLRRSAHRKGILGDWVPMYIGVPAVQNRKRFDLRGAVQAAAANMNRYFNDAMGI